MQVGGKDGSWVSFQLRGYTRISCPLPVGPLRTSHFGLRGRGVRQKARTFRLTVCGELRTGGRFYRCGVRRRFRRRA